MTWNRLRVAGANSSPVSSFSSSSSVYGIPFYLQFLNHPLFLACLALTIAQFIKFFITRYKERRWDPYRLFGSGGMPSSHSSIVTSLAIAIGIHDGFGGSLFAVCFILACVVMYDAFGVRLQTGHHAKLLNQIVYRLPEEHPLADSRPLHELLGHTPLQVIAGSMVGLAVAVGSYLTSKAWV
ncbi:Acid phosphatase/vanadium-dependent haloperoxidase related [Zostera marina]|uniref:Acid phosphatase/vanadium-dependent haloperoxidase related n=1 Tax=Zostera marina TaxID=29655 RepID=A0A0K9PJI4_ZOSMR|nr:Acid phosphatase/vanadium-dependent haloperoxidase related [Zostera marina]